MGTTENSFEISLDRVYFLLGHLFSQLRGIQQLGVLIPHSAPLFYFLICSKEIEIASVILTSEQIHELGSRQQKKKLLVPTAWSWHQ